MFKMNLKLCLVFSLLFILCSSLSVAFAADDLNDGTNFNDNLNVIGSTLNNDSLTRDVSDNLCVDNQNSRISLNSELSVNNLSSNNYNDVNVNSSINGLSANMDILSFNSSINTLSASTKTFNDIQKLINSAASGSTITLNGVYVGNGTPIKITKKLTINGAGATLNARGLSQIFNVYGSSVVIKNLKLLNGSNKKSKSGLSGAIYWKGSYGKISNCTFNNCSSFSEGGSIYFNGSYGSVSNCNFIKSSGDYGGAIYWTGIKGNLTKSKFTNCKSNYGGSVSWANTGGILSNCVFTNSSAKYIAGSVYWYHANGNLTSCSFYNSSSSSGGVICWEGNNGYLNNCSFNNVSASSTGGAIYWGAKNITIINSKFIKCKATNYGGAIYLFSPTGSLANKNVYVYNCSFNQCSAKSTGAAISISSDNGIIKSCNFNNCSSKEGSGAGIYWAGANGKLMNSSFESCDSIYGGAIYWAGNKGYMANSLFNKCYASSLYGLSGSVHWLGNDGFLNNCLFTNSIANCSGNMTRDNPTALGGSVSWFGANGHLNSSKFINSSVIGYAYDYTELFVYGGSVSWFGDNGLLSNSEFFNSSALAYVKGSSSKASAYGGSIYWNSKNGGIVNSTFYNSLTSGDSGSYAGTIYLEPSLSFVDNCSFFNTSANTGDAIYTCQSENITNSNFYLNDDQLESDMVFNVSVDLLKSYNDKFLNLKYVTILSADNLTKYVLNDEMFSAKLVNYYGTPLSNMKVTFTLNNVTYYGITNEEGIAYFNLTSSLGAGIYNIDSVFLNTSSDLYYNSNLVSAILTINKINTTLILTQSGVYCGNKNITVVCVNSLNNELISNVTVVLKFSEGTTVNNLVTDDFGSVTYNVPFVPGSYGVTSSIDNDYYVAVNNSTSFIISPYNMIISVSDYSVELGNSITLSANVTNTSKVPLNEGIVKFYVNNSLVGSANVVDGVASCVYNPDNSGNFTLIAVFTSSESYADNNKSSNIEVKKAKTTLSLDNFNATYKSKMNLTATVNSYTTVNEGIVVFYVNGSYVGSANVVNGVVSYSYVPNIVGEFDLIAIYESSNNFESSKNNSTINIVKCVASLTLTVNESYYKAVSITLNLTDSNGIPVSGVKLLISVGNNSFYLTTDSNGLAKRYLPYAPGTYKVVAKVSDDNIICDSISKSIKIIKATNSLITPTKLTTSYKSGKNFVVKVTKNSIPLVGVKLSLKVYTGTKYKTVSIVTDSNGIAKYAGSNLNVGTHKVIVSCSEPKSCMNASAKKSYIVISKAPTTVSAPKVTFKYGSNSYFKVSVKSKITTKPVSALKLYLKIYTGFKYKVYAVTTNSNGIASYNTKNLAVGNHKVVISSANGNYNVATSSTITIKK